MFTKIESLIWEDPKFKGLSDDGRILFIYVLTCKHRNIIGLYQLPIMYGAHDLGWSMERINKGLKELLAKGFINYDYEAHTIFIKNFLKYNALENPNQVKAAIKALEGTYSNSLDSALLEVLETITSPTIKPLVKALKERLGEGLLKQVDIDIDIDIDIEEEEEGSSLLDEDISKVAISYQNNGFGHLNQIIKDELISLVEEYSAEWVLESFKTSVIANKRSLGYARGVLQNWKAEGGMKVGGNKQNAGKIQGQEHIPNGGMREFRVPD